MNCRRTVGSRNLARRCGTHCWSLMLSIFFVFKLVKHLSPKGIEIRIPDMPVTLALDDNSVSSGTLSQLTQCDLMWFNATPSLRVKVTGFHSLPPSSWSCWLWDMSPPLNLCSKLVLKKSINYGAVSSRLSGAKKLKYERLKTLVHFSPRLITIGCFLSLFRKLITWIHPYRFSPWHT